MLPGGCGGVGCSGVVCGGVTNDGKRAWVNLRSISQCCERRITFIWGKWTIIIVLIILLASVNLVYVDCMAN